MKAELPNGIPVIFASCFFQYAKRSYKRKQKSNYYSSIFIRTKKKRIKKKQAKKIKALLEAQLSDHNQVIKELQGIKKNYVNGKL